jgi:hypothetical protein
MILNAIFSVVAMNVWAISLIVTSLIAPRREIMWATLELCVHSWEQTLDELDKT